LPLLEAVDQAVVVPGPQGPHPVFQDAIASGRFALAPAPHGEGWARAVNQWLNS
jgi:mannosyl-3-phosphoglycerate phosphatase